MLWLFTVLAVILGILVVGIILIQQPKSSGLGYTFGVPVNLLGVRETVQTVEKITIYLIVGFLFLVIILSSRGFYVREEGTRLEKVIEASPPVIPPPVPSQPSNEK